MGLEQNNFHAESDDVEALLMSFACDGQDWSQTCTQNYRPWECMMDCTSTSGEHPILPSPNSPITPSPNPLCSSSLDCMTSFQKPVHLSTKTKRRRKDKPLQLAKSAVASARRRDGNGKFIKNEVALQLYELERKVESMDHENSSLKDAIMEKDKELEKLRQALEQQQLINQRLLHTQYVPYSFLNQQQQQQQQQPPQISLTGRSFVVVPSPNPQASSPFLSGGTRPFAEKIDHSKVRENLKRTDSVQLAADKQQVVVSQELWEEQQKMNGFMRKMQEFERYQDVLHTEQQLNLQENLRSSQIYTQENGKIGNQIIPAFSKKMDLSSIREELGKPDRTFLDRRLEKRQEAQQVPSPVPQQMQDDDSVKEAMDKSDIQSRQEKIISPMPSQTPGHVSSHSLIHPSLIQQQQQQYQLLQQQIELLQQQQRQQQNAAQYLQAQLEQHQQYLPVQQQLLRELQYYQMIQHHSPSPDMLVESPNIPQSSPMYMNDGTPSPHPPTPMSAHDRVVGQGLPEQRAWGGPPSNIYTPPTKIGNLHVPAFTSKVDFSEIELRKTGALNSS